MKQKKQKKPLKYWKPNPALIENKKSISEVKQEVDKLLIEKSKYDLRQREIWETLQKLRQEFDSNRLEIQKLDYQATFFALNKFDKAQADKYKRGLQDYLMNI